MTTAVHPSVEWIRFLARSGADFAPFTLSPSPGIALRLNVGPPATPHEEWDSLLLRLPTPATQLTVDLLPVEIGRAAECEATARRVAETLGATGSPRPPGSPLPEFSLSAALDGVEPYNRVSVPLLTLQPADAPVLDEDEAGFFVRVFTATARAAVAGGYTYQLMREA